MPFCFSARAGSLLLAMGILLVAPTSARATTFVAMSDAELTAASDVILTGTVTRIRSVAPPGKQQIRTFVTLAVGNLLKGRLRGPEVTIRESGGRVGELTEWVYGAPQFTVGEEVLVFLQRRKDGTLSTTSLGLGKYEILGATARIVRRTLDARVIGGSELDVRTLKAMTADIQRHAMAAPTTDVDLVDDPPEANDETLPYSTVEAFTYLGQARWNEADRDQAVRYLLDDAGDPAIGFEVGADAVAAAMAAWTNVPTASITLAVRGAAPARPMGCDGVSQIVFNDPFGTVPDPSGCGGVLALGGFCSTSAGRTTVGGVTFNRITEGNITFNNGFSSCSFWNRINIAEVATHEIGHTIGIGHSSEVAREGDPLLTDATMYYRAHFDGRGAGVRTDDIAAVSSMYPDSGGDPACAGAPSGAPCADDANGCSDDVCDDAGACVHRANSAPCDDGLFCNGADTCRDGTCAVHAGDPCRNGPACADTCTEGADSCVNPVRTPCGGDGNPCTDDVCNGTGICVHPENTAACNDGNACTTGDVCLGGTCVGSPAPSCNDGNPCIVDTCDPAVGCRRTPAPEATPCSDGVFCNGLETCRGGVCRAGAPPNCDDGETCSVDACAEELGRCRHHAIDSCCSVDADCGDGDLCTVRERCDDGRCVSDPLTCPPAGPCSSITCDPEFGCRTDPLPDGSPCDDGDPCTAEDTCAAAVCGAAGGHALRVTRFRLRTGSGDPTLLTRGVLAASSGLDAWASGVIFELVDPAGVTLYRAEVGGAAFHGGAGSARFQFLDQENIRWPAAANGLQKLVFSQQGRRIFVVAKAVAPDLTAVLAAPSVTWVLRGSGVCTRALRLECVPADAGDVTCR